MLGEQFRILFLFYASPRRAASAVMDHGRLLFAVAAALVVALTIAMAAGVIQSAEYSLRMQTAQERLLAVDATPASQEEYLLEQRAISRLLDRRYFATGIRPLVMMAVIFVPFCILVLAVWDNLGGAGTILFRDYMPVLAGLLFAWTAAHLPLAAVWVSQMGGRMGPVAELQVAGLIGFLILAPFVLATVTGATLAHSALTVICGLGASVVAAQFLAHSSGLLYMLASPWLLIYGYRMFGGDLMALGGGLAERQNFKRQLELATLNPRDADAHYQLGLIYAQRRLPGDAEDRFRRALAIDPEEPDTLFQLGRLLRGQEGRGAEARELLEKAAKIDPKLQSHEVWRELGAVALAEGRAGDAVIHLKRYTGLREYDPEGLVLYGQALRAAGENEAARAAFQQAVESAQAAPKFRRHEVARWEAAARQELRSWNG